jgi:predicted DNA-binding protein (MmcQ/YjbR family)
MKLGWFPLVMLVGAVLADTEASSRGCEGAAGWSMSKAMATAKEALEKMREICLLFPDTREGDHFGETAFYVKGKLFASCGEKHGVCEITFGLEPDHAAALVANDPRFKPYPRDKRGVVLDAAKVQSWTGIKTLIRESYELRKPSKAPRKRAKKA